MNDYLVVSFIGGTWYVCAPSDESVHNSQMRFENDQQLMVFFERKGWIIQNGQRNLGEGNRVLSFCR